MSWVRCGLIAPKRLKRSVLSKLKHCLTKVMHEGEEYILIGYEGRGVVDFDPRQTLTLGVDGRHIRWFQYGKKSLSSLYNGKIEMTVGFSVRSSSRRKLSKDPKFKKLLSVLETVDTRSEEENDGISSWRLDIEQGKRADAVMKALKGLSVLLESKGIEHLVSYFDGVDGHQTGSLCKGGAYIGPMASANFNFDREVRRIERALLVFNDAETLIDGDGIEELSPSC